uniref:Uncharacterized protein n=1 Tax=viral metagenome TaxID=1070528 RepID=A0A6C0AUA2_9ZZZZ|tara:strand:+ start:8879 stop:9424 length:546 start_codon:yes stop_codon:yes gene_type:complete
MKWIEEQEYLLSIDTQLEPEPLLQILCCFIYLDHEKNIVDSNKVIIPIENKGLKKDTISSLIRDNEKEHSLIGLCKFHIPISHDDLETFTFEDSFQDFFKEYSRVEDIPFPDTLPVLHSASYMCFLFKSNYKPPPPKPDLPKSILKLKPTQDNTHKQKKTVRFFTKNGKIRPSFQKTVKKR